MQRPYALVTGASGGIGLELARILAAHGWDLFLGARSGARLQAVAAELQAGHGAGVRWAAVDLALPGAAAELLSAALAPGRPLDALVNNAGVGLHGAFAKADPGRTGALLQLNILALTELTRSVLPAMLARGHGRILNVASVAGFVPGPGMAAYYASKAYVLSLSEALAYELRGTGVTVTALCPGPTATGFAEQAGSRRSRLFSAVPVADARSVAVAGFRGMMAGRTVVIPGLLNRLQVFGLRLIPRRLGTAAAGAMQDLT